MSSQSARAVATESDTAVLPKPTVRPKRLPPYHVVLLDDNDHSYHYVIKMLTNLFRFPLEQAYALTVEVDTAGRAIVDTTSKERAELKRDQIHAFGRDAMIDRCSGSMSAVIEPAV